MSFTDCSSSSSSSSTTQLLHFTSTKVQKLPNTISRFQTSNSIQFGISNPKFHRTIITHCSSSSISARDGLDMKRNVRVDIDLRLIFNACYQLRSNVWCPFLYLKYPPNMLNLCSSTSFDKICYQLHYCCCLPNAK